MITAFEVIDPGLLTTVQDIPGRKGLRKIGVPLSGTMDTHCAELANWLVGNDVESPLLEITFGKCEFEFSKEVAIGVTGGVAKIMVGDRLVQQNETVKVAEGERLKIGSVVRGARIYLAVAGELKIKKYCGSYSTYRDAGLGGFKGRELKSGDQIEADITDVQHTEKRVPEKLIPHFSKHQQIRVIVGPEWHWLSKEKQRFILENRFGLSSSSNRMGIRLQSKKALNIAESNFSSAPVVPGIVQLPPDGQPVILMNDAQSVGGYPRILKVADADLWRLGQVWQGNEISFSLIDRRDALELLVYYRKLRESHLT
ncbi:biotin-dependent carboxyltransferase family protein [Gracilimonas sp. Q87]|uniref:5-oxoprolinase subunit C family protein n=1 Tax=Gracilimonas sp. Q87 TaxID=3384766 RepID=UPI0039840F4B